MKIQKMFKEHINFKYIDLYMKNEYISFGIIRMLWHDTILCYFNCEEILVNSMVILRKKFPPFHRMIFTSRFLELLKF